MKISIMIPSYNEEASVGKIIEKVLKAKIPNFEKEIIVVNDGSTDKTKEILSKYNKEITVINNKRNLGKGASLRKAIKIAKGSILVIQDADLEYDPSELPKLVKPFEDKNVKVVYGSRKLMDNPISHWTFNLGGCLITVITNILFQTKITDEATGYKLFRSVVVKNLKLESKGFEFCPEITAKIAKQKIKIVEVPISYNPRSPNEKKIKWWDGIAAIYYLFKYRFKS